MSETPDPTQPAKANTCIAAEWQRDGRGLWAMRACTSYAGHKGGPHVFGRWRYRVEPPAAAELIALRAALAEAQAERDALKSRIPVYLTSIPVLCIVSLEVRGMTLSEKVKTARSEAFKEAKNYGLPWVFGRGAYAATVGENGDQCDPWPGADPFGWDGKLSSLPKLIAEAKSHANVWKVVLEGGYDGADTMEKRKRGDYEPWIASWSVTLWDRNDGFTGYIPPDRRRPISAAE